MLASDRGALPPAASCPAYPAAMASLVEASGGLLPSEFARKLSAYCPSHTASAIKCETQLQAYAYMCESRHYWQLCRRQALVMRDASLNGRMYDSCAEPNLGEYFDQVSAVNLACSFQPTFRNLSDRGGSVCDTFCTYQNTTNIPWQDHCVITARIGVAFGAYSAFLFLMIGLLLLSFVLAGRSPYWFSAADMTTDVCRSRLFTTVSFTWLLYAFYSLLTDYFIDLNSEAYRYVLRSKFPQGLYFLGLSVAWVPHFVVLLLANNPYRGRYAYLVTIVGMSAEQCVAVAMLYIKAHKFWRSTPDTALKEMIIVEVVVVFLLLSIMNAAFLKMILQKGGFMHRSQISCLNHTAAALNYPRAHRTEWWRRGGGALLSASPPRELTTDGTPPRHTSTEKSPVGAPATRKGEGAGEGVSALARCKPSVALRADVHLVIPRYTALSHDAVAAYLSHKLFQGQIPPKRFVVLNIAVLRGGGGGPSEDAAPSGLDCTAMHPDLIESSTPEVDHVVTLRRLERGGGWGCWWHKRKCSVDGGSCVVRVSLLVCGVCAALQERRWLLEVLEGERDGMARNAAAFRYLDRVVMEHRRGIPVIDQTLLQLMLDSLNSFLFSEVLRMASEQGGEMGGEVGRGGISEQYPCTHDSSATHSNRGGGGVISIQTI